MNNIFFVNLIFRVKAVINKIGIKRYGVSDENYEVLSKAFRLLKKGESIENLKPMTEDLQYLISWFSVKSERGHHTFI